MCMISLQVTTLTVCDRGRPSLSTSAYLNISIIDVNDNRPRFTNSTYEATVREDAVIGHSVLTLQAERADTAVMRHSVLTIQAVDSDVGVNAQLEYLLTDVNGHFNVNRTSGELSVAKALDYEDTRLFTVDVVVMD